VTEINQSMDNVGYSDYVYQLFSRSVTYGTFATTANSGTSLEAIHGAVHNIVGGANGEMTSLAYAAFDPIFWLHHANVDRIFALWQSVYPNQYVVPQNGGASTFTMAYDTVETINSPPTPFAINSTGMYTSATARSMKTFGYTYPEINDWSQTATQLANNVSTQVNNLYSGGGSSTRRRRNPSWKRNSPITEWFAGTAVDRFALGRSFNIFVFLGCPPNNTAAYATANNLAGLSAIFAPIREPNSMPLSLNYDEVPLQRSLDALDIAPNDTAQFLKDNLEWVVVMANGTVVPNDCIPSLKIWVQEETVTPAKDDCSFPTYGKPQIRTDITQGKPGGSGP